MPRHLELGKKGEGLAIQWLETRGYTILSRNWRQGRYEIDIIAQQGSILHFIEVKTRRSTTFGHPEESVNKKKLKHLLMGSARWLYQFPGHSRIQYDVMAITLLKDSEPEIILFEDVYL